MRRSRHIAAIAAIIVFGVAVGKAAEQSKQDSPWAPSPPQVSEEGPFGGPPPTKRGVKGSKCKTAQGVCPIDPPQPIGGSCSCSRVDGGAAQGKVEK
jgi:hypothetical protein